MICIFMHVVLVEDYLCSIIVEKLRKELSEYILASESLWNYYEEERWAILVCDDYSRMLAHCIFVYVCTYMNIQSNTSIRIYVYVPF